MNRPSEMKLTSLVAVALLTGVILVGVVLTIPQPAFADANLLVNITSTSGGSAPGTWGTVPGLSASSITVQGTNSVLLLLGTVTQAEASDDSAEFRFSVNGDATGSPVVKSFTDSSTAGEVHGISLYWAVTGLSGSSNSFAMEWQDIVSGSSIDTSKPHSFQVVEIAGGDATIDVDLSSTSSASAGSESNLFQATGVSIAGTSSVLLFMGNVAMALSSDNYAVFRFGVDDTGEGARTAGGSDSTSNHDGWSWSGFHMKTGVSAGTHSFELKWQEDDSSAATDTARLRTFQVVEITANANLLATLSSTGSWTTGSEANDPNLDTDQTPKDGDSVILIAANAMINPVAEDQAAGFRIGIDDSSVGGYITDFNDDLDQAGYASVVWAATSLSGSHSFQLRGQSEQGTPAIDTTYPRTLFVLDLETGAATCDALTVVTSDPNGQLWFNETVEPDGLPWTTQNDVPASFQDGTTPALRVTNDASIACDISVKLMTDAPSGATLKGDTDNNPVGATTIPTDPSTYVACSAVAASGTCDIWLWTDYLDAGLLLDVSRTLRVESA